VSSIPNIFSAFRIITAPFLLYLAWKGYRNFFVGLLFASLLSDAVDGYVARKFNITTNLGTKLDSLGDMAIYLTVPLCAWWLLPEIIKQEALFVLIALGAYIAPLLAGIIKFKQVPSYHTFGAKFAAIFMSTAIFFLFIAEFTWVFRCAAVFQVLVALEEIWITIRLPKLQNNVKSIWHLRMNSGQDRR
jgi:CDP-diacylglycerol--glycerol-3-phosphate 3-phosphatidyltransferase